jgi:hypothetical protein
MTWLQASELDPQSLETCSEMRRDGYPCAQHFVCAGCSLVTHLSGWVDPGGDFDVEELDDADAAIYGDPPLCAGCREALIA